MFNWELYKRQVPKHFAASFIPFGRTVIPCTWREISQTSRWKINPNSEEQTQFLAWIMLGIKTGHGTKTDFFLPISFLHFPLFLIRLRGNEPSSLFSSVMRIFHIYLCWMSLSYHTVSAKIMSFIISFDGHVSAWAVLSAILKETFQRSDTFYICSIRDFISMLKTDYKISDMNSPNMIAMGLRSLVTQL